MKNRQLSYLPHFLAEKNFTHELWLSDAGRLSCRLIVKFPKNDELLGRRFSKGHAFWSRLWLLFSRWLVLYHLSGLQNVFG